MTDQPIPINKDETSLLDILVTLAQSWRLLVFGPLIVGVLAGALSFLWPKTFESVTIVRMVEEELVLLHTPPVLDSLIQKLDLMVDVGGDLDDVRQRLKNRLTFAVDKKTRLATISAKAHSPEAARALASSALLVLTEELRVKGRERELLEKKLEINNRAIEIAEAMLKIFQQRLKKSGDEILAQESLVRNILSLQEQIVNLSQENEVNKQKLQPKGVEVIVQEADLPSRVISPNRYWVVLMAIIASGFALLVFVFMRKAIVLAAMDPDFSTKLASIRAELGLRTRSN